MQSKYDYEMIFQQLLKEKSIVAGGNTNTMKTINLQKFLFGLYMVLDKIYPGRGNDRNRKQKQSWGYKEFKKMVDVLKDEFVTL